MYDTKDRIKTNLNLKGYILYKSFTGSAGEPVEAFLRLFAVKDGEKIKIEKASDFYKVIRIIRNEQEALDLVRFFTDINNHFLFNDIDYIEVYKIPNEEDPGFGELRENEFKKFFLKEPSVYVEKGKFIIERNLIRYPNGKRLKQLVRSKETVTLDGHYFFEVKEVIAEGESIKILLKYYE
ncbi:MAG: hypothetical protein HZA08_04080 [Nitrospirae bacterium]|nr:hypothetical protein [Nitrospirota bacterium]